MQGVPASLTALDVDTYLLPEFEVDDTPRSINSTSATGLYPGAFSPVQERPQVLEGAYSVFAVNDLGMHCVDLDGRIANILPPFQVMVAQVIRKGAAPELNPADVELHYSAASNPLDPALDNAARPGLAADGTGFKTRFWEGIPHASYDAFYPPQVTPLATGPFPVTPDTGLPVPNAELLYLGENGIVGDGDEYLSAVQQAMPGNANPLVKNSPQSLHEHYRDKPFFINFPIGYIAESVNWFEAPGIPGSPFDDDGRLNPFPLARVEASMAGEVVSTVDTVLPVSAETSCTNCHASPLDNPQALSAAPAQALAAAGLVVSLKTADPEFAVGGVPESVSLEYAADLNILRLHDLRHGSAYVKPAMDGDNVVHEADACSPYQGSNGSPSCLLARALDAGQPIVCQSCHYTPALDLAQSGPVSGPPGSPANGRNQLVHETNSRVMHNHHGNLPGLFPAIPPAVQDPATGVILNQVERLGALESNCYQCHPGKETKCLRGAMFNAGILCSDCHGSINQVGADFSAGVSAANPGAFVLDQGNFYDSGSPQARVPWANEPGCGSCHTGSANDNLTQQAGVMVNLRDSRGVRDGIRLRQAFLTGDAKATPIVPGNKLFAEPLVPEVFNGFANPAAGNPKLYRVSTGHGGVMCQGCHGSTHAEWPLSDPNANDNQTAIQLQGHTGPIIECTTCHDTQAMQADTLDGPHGMHLVDDRRFWKEAHKDIAKRENGKPGGGLCGDCHGADHRGTVLSRAATDRRFYVEDSWRAVSAGEPVSCDICHSLSKSFGS
ncbi:MAG: cytochrome C [Halioglobus sp.]|nr:cytochrome C [Halioglobus sp.]